MWSALAKRYANTSKIAGYEVMSEPRTTSPASLVHSIQQEVCNAVWLHDPNATCFIGPAKFYDRHNLNGTYLLSGGPVIYAANFFEPKVWVTSKSFNNTIPYGSDFPCTAVYNGPEVKAKCGSFHSNKTVKVDRTWIAAELDALSTLSKKYNVPIWIDQVCYKIEKRGGMKEKQPKHNSATMQCPTCFCWRWFCLSGGCGLRTLVVIWCR
jgi:hypothetical protein